MEKLFKKGAYAFPWQLSFPFFQQQSRLAAQPDLVSLIMRNSTPKPGKQGEMANTAGPLVLSDGELKEKSKR